MFKILFVVGLTVFISTALGLYIQDFLNLKEERYHAPLGFAALLFLLQLFYYPAQLFNLTSSYIHVVSSLVYLVLLYFGFIQMKRIFLEYWNIKTIWMISYVLVFIFVFYHMSIAIARADGQMYLNYIAQNIDINQLNMFNLWTGKTGAEFVSVYFFQGYYHYAAFLVKFVNIFSSLGIGSPIDTIVVSIWGLGILLAIMSSLAIVNFTSTFKYKNFWIERIILLFALFYTNFYYWKIAFAFYGNSWRSLFMALLAYYLYRMIKDDEKNAIFPALIVFGASITVSSSSLFIGFSMLYGLAYFWFKHEHSSAIEELSTVALPMVLYVLALLYKDHFEVFAFLMPITLVFYLIRNIKSGKKILSIVNTFFSKYSFWIFVIIIPAFAVVYSFYSLKVDIYYPWNLLHYFNNHANYDMVKNYLFMYSNPLENLLSALRWFGIGLLWFKYRKNKETNYVLSHFIMLGLLFLNPFATSFVSKAFASNVYYRLFESLFNAFSEILIFSVLLNHYWSEKMTRTFIILLLITLVGYTHITSFILKDPSSAYGFYIKQGEDVLPLYKIRSTELDAIRALQEELDDLDQNQADQITVITHADTLRTYLPEVYVLFTPREYYTPGDRVNEEFYQIARFWYAWEEKPMLNYSNTCAYITEFNVDYIISERYINYEFDGALNSCTVIIRENEEFNVRKVVKR